MNNSTYDANTSPIFKEHKLLKFRDIHSFQLGFFMFSLKNSTLPSKFNNLFLINSQIKSIIIILGMPTHFACHYAERTPDSSQFISKVQSFIIR